MIKHLIISLSLFVSYVAKADFVDIATLKVNGKLVRRLTNNNHVPYLVNLSRFHAGDTLSVQIRTDHGAENNSYLSLQNLENKSKQLLTKDHYLIITTDLLQKKHLLSVTYILDYPEETEVTWDICTFTPDEQIEQVYASINELRDLLLSAPNKKPPFSSTLFMDSITTNYQLSVAENGIRNKILKDTLNYSITKISDFLVLNPTEKTFIQKIDAIDYVKLHDFTSQLHASIILPPQNLDTFQFLFGDFDHSARFLFRYIDGQYKLEKIGYEKRK